MGPSAPSAGLMEQAQLCRPGVEGVGRAVNLTSTRVARQLKKREGLRVVERWQLLRVSGRCSFMCWRFRMGET